MRFLSSFPTLEIDHGKGVGGGCVGDHEVGVAEDWGGDTLTYTLCFHLTPGVPGLLSSIASSL